MPREKGRPGHAVIHDNSDMAIRHRKIAELFDVSEHLRNDLDSSPDYFGLSLHLDKAVDDVVLEILESSADSITNVSHLYLIVLQSPTEISDGSMHRYAPFVREEVPVKVLREVRLTRGFVALVDDDDYNRVNQHEWEASVSGASTYGVRKIEGEDGRVVRQYLHDFILNPPDGKKVHHINGSGLDNRRENLRLTDLPPALPQVKPDSVVKPGLFNHRPQYVGHNEHNDRSENGQHE